MLVIFYLFTVLGKKKDRLSGHTFNNVINYILIVFLAFCDAQPLCR